MNHHRPFPGWFALAALALLLLTLILSGAACPSATRTPQPTRYNRPIPRRTAGQPTPRRTTLRPAPTTIDLGGAIQLTRTAVARGDWAAADRYAARIGSGWKPVVAGRAWPAADITLFQSNYAKLRTAIKAKDRGAADRALGEMDRLERKNAMTSRTGPTGVRPAPTRAVRPMAPTR